MGRPSKAELQDEEREERLRYNASEDRDAVLTLLNTLVSAKGGLVDDYVTWSILAVDKIRTHYGQ